MTMNHAVQRLTNSDTVITLWIAGPHGEKPATARLDRLFLFFTMWYSMSEMIKKAC